MEERKREKFFFSFFSSTSFPYLSVGWKHKKTLRLAGGRVGRARACVQEQN